jgi:hypothetical protein
VLVAVVLVENISTVHRPQLAQLSLAVGLVAARGAKLAEVALSLSAMHQT